MAKTMSGGSTRNGRDSHSKRLGIKLADGQFCHAGSIIFRQRGTKIFPGNNAGRGNDDTIYALITGIVKFERRKNRVFASVYPVVDSQETVKKEDKKVDKTSVKQSKTTKKTTTTATSKTTAKKAASKKTSTTKTATKKSTTTKKAATKKTTAAKKTTKK